MKKLLYAAIALALASTPIGARQQGPGMAMAFTDTDVAQVLKAIGLRTGATIVYAGKDKATTTVNATVHSAEEAIRAVAVSSGLVYRKVKDVFVVATPSTLRQAIEPYGYTAAFEMDQGQSALALPVLEQAIPYGTMKRVGNRIMVTGTLDDLRDAATVVGQFKLEQAALEPVSTAVDLSYLSATEASNILKETYSTVHIAAADDARHGGTVEVIGPSAMVVQAISMIRRLDVPGQDSGPNGVTCKVYHLRYLAPVQLTAFLKKAAPDVEAILGPEIYTPPRASFSPLTSHLSGGGSGSSGGSSGSSGGSSQSSSGGGGGGSSSGGGSSDHQWQAGDRVMTVVLKGSRSAVEAAYALVQGLDLKPHQVILEARIIETSPSFEENLGLLWNLTNTQTIQEGAAGAAGIGFGKFTRITPLSFSATLNASIVKGESKILANPKIQVTENDDADIFIGDTIRTQISQATGLGGQTVSVQEFPIGIILLLRARIEPSGNISLHVNPVVSAVSSVDSNGIPQTSSREAETNVIVKDGETIAIGGLIRDDVEKTISEVPFLSKLPIVGQLFRNRHTSRKHTDVIVTITPRIVNDPEAGK